MTQRELTPSEEKVVSFLQEFDRLSSDRRLSAKVQMKPAALDALKTDNIAKPLKTIYNQAEDLHVVTFTLTEFKKYIDYWCKRVGLTVKVTGEIITYDGLILTEEEYH